LTGARGSRYPARVTELRFDDVSLRGVRVRYGEAGAGPPLVLIHGFLVSHREWLPMLPSLAHAFRVVALDLPGFGQSEKPRPESYPYTREAFAETVADLMSHLGLVRAHVCGHSMGGSIAITLAADRSELVDRLVLIDSACFPFDVPLEGRLALVPVLGPFVFKKLYGRSVLRDYFRNDVWSGHTGMDLAQVDAYFDAFDPPEAREAAYACLRATTDLAPLVPKIARVRAKTLVIWGDDDRIFPLSLGRRLAREMPDARLRVVPHCGHAPNEEHPAKTAELILEFLAGGA
jgi:pimeloyl-ACP methyl ester carboxylesterase